MIFRAFIEGNHSTFNYVFYDYFITSFPQAVHLRCTGKENYQIYQLTILNSNRGKENMTSIYVCILSPFRMYNFIIQQPAAPYSLAKIWRHRVHRIDSVCGLVYFYQTAHQKFNHHVFHRANFQLFCLKGTSPSRCTGTEMILEWVLNNQLTFGPGHAKMCLMPYASNKGADQPAHPCSLISAFVVRSLDSIISLVSRSEISRF